MPEAQEAAPNTYRRTVALEMESEMNRYLARYRQALNEHSFGIFTPEHRLSFEKHGGNLVKQAKTFDQQTTYGIGDMQLVAGKEMMPVLGYLNRGTRLGSRNFTETILEYYEGLRRDIEGVISKVQEDGTDYFMHDLKPYREEAMLDMEALSKKFGWASDDIRDQLCFRSNDYLVVERERESRVGAVITRFRAMGIKEEEFPSVLKHMVLSRLQRVAHEMASGSPQAAVCKDLILGTNDLMHHLSENIGKKGVHLLSAHEGRRRFHTLPGGPLQQFEAMLTLLNDMIREYEDCVVLHRDLLLGAK